MRGDRARGMATQRQCAGGRALSAHADRQLKGCSSAAWQTPRQFLAARGQPIALARWLGVRSGVAASKAAWAAPRQIAPARYLLVAHAPAARRRLRRMPAKPCAELSG